MYAPVVLYLTVVLRVPRMRFVTMVSALPPLPARGGSFVPCGATLTTACPSGNLLEYTLMCEGTATGANVCVTCGPQESPSRRKLDANPIDAPKPPVRRELRMMMKKKSSKSKSVAVMPMPEMFTVVLDTQTGECTSTGTFTALSATTTCVTPMRTYTVTASVAGFEADSGKSSKGKGRS